MKPLLEEWGASGIIKDPRGSHFLHPNLTHVGRFKPRFNPEPDFTANPGLASKGRSGITRSEWSHGHQYSSESGGGSWETPSLGSHVGVGPQGAWADEYIASWSSLSWDLTSGVQWGRAIAIPQIPWLAGGSTGAWCG